MARVKSFPVKNRGWRIPMAKTQVLVVKKRKRVRKSTVGKRRFQGLRSKVRMARGTMTKWKRGYYLAKRWLNNNLRKKWVKKF